MHSLSNHQKQNSATSSYVISTFLHFRSVEIFSFVIRIKIVANIIFQAMFNFFLLLVATEREFFSAFYQIRFYWIQMLACVLIGMRERTRYTILVMQTGNIPAALTNDMCSCHMCHIKFSFINLLKELINKISWISGDFNQLRLYDATSAHDGIVEVFIQFFATAFLWEYVH